MSTPTSTDPPPTKTTTTIGTTAAVAVASLLIGAGGTALITSASTSSAPPTLADLQTQARALADGLDAYAAAQPTPTPTPTVSPSDVPTTSPTPTPSSATPTPSPSGSIGGSPIPTVTAGALPYTAPTLTNPVTITIAASGGTYTQPSTVDCRIVAPAKITGPVTLNGCDDRVWVGGVFGGRLTKPSGSYDSTHRGIRLGDSGSSANGTDYIEGIWFSEGYLSDAIQIAHRSTSRTVILQNIRVDAITYGTAAGVHADTLQCWGGPRTLLVYGLTARAASYQGTYCDAGDGRTLPSGPGLPWSFTRVNIVGYGSDVRYLYADRQPAFTRATATDFWISGSKYGDNSDSFGNAPAGVRVGLVTDFVPASRWVAGVYQRPGMAA